MAKLMVFRSGFEVGSLDAGMKILNQRLDVVNDAGVVVASCGSGRKDLE